MDLTDQAQTANSTLLTLPVTRAIDPQWGVMAMDWDVSLRLAINIDVVAGTFGRFGHDDDGDGDGDGVRTDGSEDRGYVLKRKRRYSNLQSTTQAGKRGIHRLCRPRNRCQGV